MRSMDLTRPSLPVSPTLPCRPELVHLRDSRGRTPLHLVCADPKKPVTAVRGDRVVHLAHLARSCAFRPLAVPLAGTDITRTHKMRRHNPPGLRVRVLGCPADSSRPAAVDGVRDSLIGAGDAPVHRRADEAQFQDLGPLPHPPCTHCHRAPLFCWPPHHPSTIGARSGQPRGRAAGSLAVASLSLSRSLGGLYVQYFRSWYDASLQ